MELPIIRFVGDIRDDPRFKAEKRVFGEREATRKSLGRVFQNEHYISMKSHEERQKAWEGFVKNAGVDDLIVSARDLFELIENKTGGVFRFVPMGEQLHSWVVKGSERVRTQLYLSSDVEMEIWRRVTDRKELPTKYIQVFGKAIMPGSLVKAFGEYGNARDFRNTTNEMPRVVESAFNHIPEVGRKFKVKGFRYPHPVSPMVYGCSASYAIPAYA